MQPFSSKTIEVLLIAVTSFLAIHYSFANKEGLLFLIIRSVLFSAIFIVAVYVRNISPDVKPVFANVRKRLKI